MNPIIRPATKADVMGYYIATIGFLTNHPMGIAGIVLGFCIIFAGNAAEKRGGAGK